MSCFMTFIMQVQKMPLHMNGDNGQTVLNGRWSGSNSQRKENDYETD